MFSSTPHVSRCARAEENLDSALEDHAATVREKDKALEALKAEYAQLFETLRRLVDPDLALTTEINDAKKLVEAGNGGMLRGTMGQNCTKSRHLSKTSFPSARE